jgi:hypothetical protein
VDPKRRDFLKLVLGGAVFAVPLIASFSIDGLSIDAPEALGAPYCVPNMPDPGYVGPTHFVAYFSDPNQPFFGTSRVNGKATFTVKKKGAALAYKLSASPGATLTAGRIALAQTSDKLVDLSTQPTPKGTIDVTDVTTVGFLCDFGALLEEIAAEATVVVVDGTFQTQPFTLQGTIRRG